MALKTAFPDFKTTINKIIAEGDRVLVFTNTTGTHEGPFVFAPGIAPTGKVLSFQTADLYTVAENGKIVEHKDVIEIMNMLQKMKAIQFVKKLFVTVAAITTHNRYGFTSHLITFFCPLLSNPDILNE